MHMGYDAMNEGNHKNKILSVKKIQICQTKMDQEWSGVRIGMEDK